MRKLVGSLALLVLLGPSAHGGTAKSTKGKPDRRPLSVAGKKVTIFTTAKDTDLRLTEERTVEFKDKGQPLESETVVFVDPDKTFQTILGIGGALTDAAAETFAKLPKEKRQEVLRAYYDPEKGIGYSLARTNIHSCDFSSGSYTYITEGDAELKSFDISHDRQFRIPMIREAIAAAGGKLTLFASPWSPPAFMKDNNDMLKGGKLKKDFQAAWANYFAKFIQSYEAEGIPIWGVTIQNEPMATQRWESCIFTAEEERDFLKNHLGPTLRKAGLGSRKIIGWDHNRDLLYQRASTLLNDPVASSYLWGIGFHWYEYWTGGAPMHDNLKLATDAFPQANFLFTEGSAEMFDPEKVSDWNHGERYGSNMIRDFNSGSVGFTDWNILLDEKGGPNHVGNFCFAPIHGNTATGELTYVNSYYYIGHFSKFVRPGARRIVASSTRSHLLSTAFLNPDGTIAVIVMNSTEKPASYFLWINGKAMEAVSRPRSISTLVLSPR